MYLITDTYLKQSDFRVMTNDGRDESVALVVKPTLHHINYMLTNLKEWQRQLETAKLGMSHEN